MEGRNQLELGMEQLDGGGQLVSSTFVPEADERESTQAGIIYSFSPSVAFQGDRFVVASTKQLARQLMRSPSDGANTTASNTTASLQADVLRRVLDDNREQLIAQNMLKDGNSRQEAEAIIDLVLQVVGYFQDASLRLGTHDDQLSLELQIRLDQ